MVDRGRLDFCKDLIFVDSRIRSSAPCETVEPLPVDFEPGKWDVICLGGRESYDHSKFVCVCVCAFVFVPRRSIVRKLRE